MTAAQITTWFQKNGKGILVITGITAVVITIALTLHKFFGQSKSTTPNVSNPNTDPVELDRMTAIYNQYKPALSHDELYYKSLADSLQTFFQTTTFLERDEVYRTYFKDVDVAGFVAVYYFWGPSREYTGSFFNNPWMGIDDRYGNLIETLKARCWAEDFQTIQQKYQSTGLI